MSYAALKEDLVELYSTQFTAAELQELSKFYATPVGKKALAIMPELMSQGAQIGSRRVQEHQDELKSMLMAERERLNKK